MKYDVVETPIGSVARVKAQLVKLDLHKALNTCRIGNIALNTVKTEIDKCVKDLYQNKSFGVILSGYYEAGVFAEYSVLHLLQKLYEVHDFSSFLKQSYRFDVYANLRTEIEAVIEWHFTRGLPDAAAWKHKFNKLHEQSVLHESGVQCATFPIEEEVPEYSTEAPKCYELKPLKTAERQQSQTPLTEPVDDPYIISQTARVKLEQANKTHREVLQSLKNCLNRCGLSVSESKLIDAFAVLSEGPAIFEVKSITEANEREQIRHALSQLYEYRFLHSLHNATLWVVFSQRLSSDWYVNYLTQDRGLHVIWREGEAFDGPSAGALRSTREMHNT
jgi:hypothetical protein